MHTYLLCLKNEILTAVEKLAITKKLDRLDNLLYSCIMSAKKNSKKIRKRRSDSNLKRNKEVFELWYSGVRSFAMTGKYSYLKEISYGKIGRKYGMKPAMVRKVCLRELKRHNNNRGIYD